jgi:hypothetical protein
MCANINKFGDNDLKNIYITTLKKSISTGILRMTNSKRNYTLSLSPNIFSQSAWILVFFLSLIFCSYCAFCIISCYSLYMRQLSHSDQYNSSYVSRIQKERDCVGNDIIFLNLIDSWVICNWRIFINVTCIKHHSCYKKEKFYQAVSWTIKINKNEQHFLHSHANFKWRFIWRGLYHVVLHMFQLFLRFYRVLQHPVLGENKINSVTRLTLFFEVWTLISTACITNKRRSIENNGNAIHNNRKNKEFKEQQKSHHY